MSSCINTKNYLFFCYAKSWLNLFSITSHCPLHHYLSPGLWKQATWWLILWVSLVGCGFRHQSKCCWEGTIYIIYFIYRAFQVALVVKNPPAKAGDIRDVGSVPGLGRSPRDGNGNPLQYSCLDNLMDRGAWWGYIPWGHKDSDMTEHAHTSCWFCFSGEP